MRFPRRAAACLALAAVLWCAPAAAQPQPEECLVVVTVYWPDHDLSTAQVRVFRDEQRRDLLEAFPATGADGKVVVAVSAGTYYLTVVVDADKNGQLGAGDGLGFYGVTDPSTERPQPTQIKPGAAALQIPVSLTMGAEGKLSPTGVKAPVEEAPGTAAPTVRVEGQVTDGEPSRQIVVYAVPASGKGACYAALSAEPGRTFALTPAAGDYYLFAVQDANASESLDAGDLVAVRGYTADQGRGFPMVPLKENASDVMLSLQWRLTGSGLLKSLDGAADGPQMAPSTVPAVVFGAVAGAAEAAKITVRACADAGFRQDVASVSATGGRFLMALPVGMYFLGVMADSDGDGKASAGDLVGFHGVSTLRKGHGPQPLLLSGGELRPLDLTVCARLDAELRPEPAEAAGV